MVGVVVVVVAAAVVVVVWQILKKIKGQVEILKNKIKRKV